MSQYGAPPSDPNQPNPYGQSSPYGQPGYPAGTPAPYAHWGKRVGALLIDVILTMVAAIPLWIGYALIIAGAETTREDGMVMMENNDIGAAPILLILVGFATYFGFFIWNTVLKQGKTGYSIGKGVLGIKLIGMQTGQPIGGGMTFVRQIVHIVDSLPCYIGYLWPLWDDKKQTFADKIMSTVVIDQPKG